MGQLDTGHFVQPFERGVECHAPIPALPRLVSVRAVRVFEDVLEAFTLKPDVTNISMAA
jgi:hypothetical protein